MAIQKGKEREVEGSNCGNAARQAVHVVQNAKGGRDAHDPQQCKRNIQDGSRPSADGQKVGSDVEPNAERNEGRGGKRHGDEKLDLMMKQAAIIERAGCQKQCGPCQDAENLASGLAVQRKHDRNDCAPIDCDATQQRHGSLMQLASVRLINHSDVEGQPPHRRGQTKGNGQSDSKGEHSG